MLKLEARGSAYRHSLVTCLFVRKVSQRTVHIRQVPLPEVDGADVVGDLFRGVRNIPKNKIKIGDVRTRYRNNNAELEYQPHKPYALVYELQTFPKFVLEDDVT